MILESFLFENVKLSTLRCSNIIWFIYLRMKYIFYTDYKQFQVQLGPNG